MSRAPCGPPVHYSADGRPLHIFGASRFLSPLRGLDEYTAEIDGGLLVVGLTDRRRGELQAEGISSSWDLVFTRPDSLPLHGKYVLSEFKALLDGVGLPEMTFHELRHAYASLALGQGAVQRSTQAIAYGRMELA